MILLLKLVIVPYNTGVIFSDVILGYFTLHRGPAAMGVEAAMLLGTVSSRACNGQFVQLDTINYKWTKYLGR
jgi:hypothetical protein